MTEVFTETERHDIVGRARTLHKRQEDPRNTTGADPAVSPDDFLERWQSLYPDESSFRDRLDRTDLTIKEVRELVSRTRWPDNVALPDWIDELESMVAFLTGRNPDDETEPQSRDNLPFAPFVEAIATYAVSRLPERLQRTTSDLVDWLVDRIKLLSERTLYVEFKSFLEYHEPALLDRSPDDYADPPTHNYDAFMAAMFGEGFTNLCLEYPLLARHLVRLVDQWVAFVEELHERTAADRPALEREFDCKGRVTGLQPLAGDAHRNGRVPVLVLFEHGSVVYKPRPVDTGVAFNSLLETISSDLDTASFDPPQYEAKNDYGWMETVTYEEPDEEAGVDRYYERTGALLGVAYAMNLIDCQCENVIAAGDSPIVVDSETLCQAPVDASASPSPTTIRSFVDSTVLSTGLVPWCVGNPPDLEKSGAGVVASGIGLESGTTDFPVESGPSIVAPETDVMTVVEEHRSVDRSTNTLSLEGIDRPPGASVDVLVQAFEETYAAVQQRYETGSLLEKLEDIDADESFENRFLFRNTMDYATILDDARRRRTLRDGVCLTLEMERLAVPFYDGSIDDDRYFQLYDAERRSIRRLDIPWFSTEVDGQSVFHDGRRLAAETKRSGKADVRQKLAEMDDEDRGRQATILRRAFSSGGDEPARTTSSTGSNPVSDRSEAAFEREALELVDQIAEATIGPAGDRTSVSIRRLDDGALVVPAKQSIYYGRCGMALTASAAWQISRRNRYRSLARELLQPILDDVRRGEGPSNPGGMVGIGAVVYALTRVAEFLGSEEYETVAHELALANTPEELAGQSQSELMGGSAGTLLGMLTQYERSGDERVLERAVACGENLLRARVERAGHRVWPTESDDGVLTGFAHGTSGITYALARLASVTGEERFVDAVMEGLAFESAQYDPDRGNWTYSSATETFEDMWCHGRTGIGLARIGVGESVNEPGLVEHGAEVLSRTADAALSTVDNVCCGNFGRAEGLHVAAERGTVNRADANAFTARCLSRRDNEGLSMPGHGEGLSNPTFFNGLAGVAYTLLRLQNPEDLPSVLLLE